MVNGIQHLNQCHLCLSKLTKKGYLWYPQQDPKTTQTNQDLGRSGFLFGLNSWNLWIPSLANSHILLSGQIRHRTYQSGGDSPTVWMEQKRVAPLERCFIPLLWMDEILHHLRNPGMMNPNNKEWVPMVFK